MTKLDSGETVQVTQWNADGSTRVQYRGAAWSAMDRCIRACTAADDALCTQLFDCAVP